MLVMPATNAVRERPFSALKRLKTYLRSTTGEARLSHLMLLFVHKELADGIDMVEVTNLRMTSGASTCSGSFHKTTRRLSLRLPLRQPTQFNNELIPDPESLTGKTLA